MARNCVSSFEAKFNPERYRTQTTSKESQDFFMSLAMLYHDVFSAHEPRGERLLDVGSGPCVWQVII